MALANAEPMMTPDRFESSFVLYASFAATDTRLAPAERPAAAAAAERALTGVALRGAYSLAGFRAEADMLLWLLGSSADELQDALVAFRHTDLGRTLRPWWTAIGVHRQAEFSPIHQPAFIAGQPPGRYVCVYPYVRSLEWYLLPPEERRSMLAEHGRMGREYPQVRANTVAAFALGDYEWLLAFEADELEPLVDLMRHLRGADARRHTRHELPFLTGVRKPLEEVVADLP
ncbi:MAG TPA: hydrogen peroxide-dependent heme synthase [Solirubrobacteraceae bacterium]|nr:hydrogen peroxide-dependent heme synthase [Solirubrobacteraceae bacterium]